MPLPPVPSRIGAALVAGVVLSAAASRVVYRQVPPATCHAALL